MLTLQEEIDNNFILTDDNTHPQSARTFGGASNEEEVT